MYRKGEAVTLDRFRIAWAVLVLGVAGCAPNVDRPIITGQQVGAAITANAAMLAQVDSDVTGLRQKIERMDLTMQGFANGQAGLVNAVGQIGNRTTTTNFDQVTLWILALGAVLAQPVLYLIAKWSTSGYFARKYEKIRKGKQ